MVRYKEHYQTNRWAEAEAEFLRHPSWATNYAHTFLQGRWPEAEALLDSDHPRASAWIPIYCKHVYPYVV